MKKSFVPDTESTLAIAALPTILVGDITSWTFINHKTRTSKTLAIIVFNVTYKLRLFIGNEEMDARTGMGVVEESGEEVGLEGERIRGGKGV